MSIWFLILTIVFIIVSAVMVLIILVQRPQGGGLAGAFGGAGGGGTDTVFGGRVGDALTMMTVAAFVVYLALAIGLNIIDPRPSTAATLPGAATPGIVDQTGTNIPVQPVDPSEVPTDLMPVAGDQLPVQTPPASQLPVTPPETPPTTPPQPPDDGSPSEPAVPRTAPPTPPSNPGDRSPDGR